MKSTKIGGLMKNPKDVKKHLEGILYAIEDRISLYSNDQRSNNFNSWYALKAWIHWKTQ